ncbi:hypothetical protein [Desulfonatronum parangueonense]
MSDTEQRYRRFYDFVVEQAVRRKWVGKDNETQWLQMATFDLDLEPFSARALVLGAAAARDAFVETEVERVLDELVKQAAGRSRRLSKKDFTRISMLLQAFSRNALDQDHAEQLVKDAVLRNNLKPRGNGLFRSRRWFRTKGLPQLKV